MRFKWTIDERGRLALLAVLSTAAFLDVMRAASRYVNELGSISLLVVGACLIICWPPRLAAGLDGKARMRDDQ